MGETIFYRRGSYDISYLTYIGMSIAHCYTNGSKTYHAHIVVTIASCNEVMISKVEMIKQTHESIGLINTTTYYFQKIGFTKICIGNAI